MMIEDLKGGCLFARLSEEQLKRVSSKARRIVLQEGQCLFTQGEKAERFFLLVRGQIKLFRLSPQGDEKVIEVLLPCSTFGEALMFLDLPRYPVSAAALSPTELIAIDAHDFADMLRSSVDTCFLLLGDMSQRLRGLIREIDELSLQNATCRVAGYFLQQAPADGNEFDLGVPKNVVASRLSIKPETFSRIIKNLSSEGLITVEGTHVILHDRQRLGVRANVCAERRDYLQSTFQFLSNFPERSKPPVFRN
jgi:CRP-like cAMP-binding protein